MTVGLVTLQTITYGLSLWLGLYLAGRNPANPQLRFASLGLVFYALNLAGDLLVSHASSPILALTLTRLLWPLLFLPALLWCAAIIYLLPEGAPPREILDKIQDYGLLSLALPFYLLGVATNLIFDFSQTPPRPGPAYAMFAWLVLLPALAALFFVGRLFRTAVEKKPFGLLLAATLFFTLAAGLLVFPLDWLPRRWLLLAVSVDFVALGLGVALLDAFEEGESLLPDFVRSFDSAAVMALLFGTPVGLTIALGPGLTLAMLALLLATVTLAITTQTFSDQLQAAFDRVAFAAFPRLRQARTNLRAAASALPRVDESASPTNLPDEEFIRLTRRALGHLGNLPRLATSPLTRLPLINTRLARRGAQGDTLERAAELNRLLTESIARLKPPGQEEFGTSEAWRYYNALYFPYVAGLKPYSRRVKADDLLEPTAREALDWFQTYVPERTLYNWQNAAAALVAQDLRERQTRSVQR